MTKQEQIEEMAKNYCKNGLFCGKFCQTDGCRTYETCETLYNAGYRKIDDKCVVITKDDLNLYKKQAVKEFAENLKEKIKSLKVAEDENYIFKCGFDVLQENLPKIIDELLKE